MKQFFKEFIVLSTILLLIILILANPISIIWGIAFIWALGVLNVQS